MITSGGCNAQDHLLDDPRSIDCVDANSCQKNLLDLKMVVFLSGSHKLLEDLFLRGINDNFYFTLENVLKNYI